MDAEPLGYPFEGRSGYNALVGLTGALLLVALGSRYAGALLPSVVAVGAFLATVLGLLSIAGYLGRVLVEPASTPPAPPVRAILSSGVRTLAIVVAFAALPVGLLLIALLGTTDGEAPTTGSSMALLFGSTAALFSLLGVAYVVPVVIARLESGSGFAEAVATGRLLPTLRDTSYLAWWSGGFPMIVVGGGLVSVTVRSAGFAGVVAAVAAAYLLLAGTRAIARGYEAAVVAGTLQERS